MFSQSVQGLQSSDTPKLPFLVDLLRRPYMRHCDKQYAVDTIFGFLPLPMEQTE